MRAIKTKTSKGKPAGAAQRDRKNPSRRKPGQPRSAGRVGPSARKGESAIRDYQPPAVSIPLAGRSGVMVDMVTLPKGSCLLDTDEKLLQAMEDIYPFFSKLKGFKDNARWSDKSSIAEVFHMMMAKGFKAIQAEDIEIIREGGNYKISVLSPIYFDISCPNLPVYFIHAIEHVSPTLFDLCFYMVVYLIKHVEMETWEEDRDNYVYEGIENGIVDYKSYHGADQDKQLLADLEEALDTYKDTGKAMMFHKRLMRSGSSKRVWLKEFESYNPVKPIEKDFYKWLELGKKIMEAGEILTSYIHIPKEMIEEYENGGEMPETPDHSFKLVWRNDDPFFDEFSNMQEIVNNNQGSLPFYFKKKIENPEDLKSIEHTFPELVMKFLAKGRELERKYRAIFWTPERLKKAFYKTKPLIDIL